MTITPYESVVLTGISIFFIIALIGAVCRPPRTRRYRRELVDLYVSGKIRQLADKDKIDLEEEYKIFRKYTKKRTAEEQPLDNTIEMEMQDKIVDDAEKESKKTTK
jgi:hypothetical protein